ncbi:MAG: hypothetical protein FJW39_09125 [Acidobacteria bacterium]|nr:hypothetical protein [Acidobacteriota bacterium]
MGSARWLGRPVYFQVIGPWTHPARVEQPPVNPNALTLQRINQALLLFVVFGALAFARHNFKQGRVDREGAMTLAIFLSAASFIPTVLRAHFTVSNGFWNMVYNAAAQSLFIGLLGWIGYLALEPPVRRRWPQAMITWTRMFKGQWRDPMVAGHLLTGLAAGAVAAVVSLSVGWFTRETGQPLNVSLRALSGDRFIVSQLIFAAVLSPALNAVVNFFLLFLFRWVFRREMLAAALFVLSFSMLRLLGTNPVLAAGVSAAVIAMLVAVAMRFGMLAFAASYASTGILRSFQFTLDPGTWHGPQSMFVMLLFAVLSWYLYKLAARKTVSLTDRTEV